MVETHFPSDGYYHRWRNREGRMGLGPPLLFLGGGKLNFAFCANKFVSNTISIGSIVQLNCLIKNIAEIWQYFVNILCNMLFVI